MLLQIIFLGLFLAVSIDQCAAEKCYQCTEPMGKNLECENNLSKVPQVSCPVGCVRFTFTNIGVTILHRDCGDQAFCDNIKLDENEYNSLECTPCSGDLCNYAFKSTTSNVLLVGLLITAILKFI